MRFFCFLLILAATGGCAGTFTEIPAGASVFRCTEYDGQGSTPLTGTAVSADGFQCLVVGDTFATSEITYESEGISVRVTPVEALE